MEEHSKVTNSLYLPFLMMLVFCKYVFLSLRYYPILDDHIMYLGWHLYDKNYLWLELNNYTIRPVAHFLDIYLWSRFYDNLFALLCIITLLNILFVYLLGQAFDKAGYSIKFELALLCLLLPVGCEATYWLAASTRIVVGMFFAALSFKFLLSEGRLRLPGFIIFNVISLFFYEQVSVISIALGLILIIKAKINRWYLTVPIINAVVFTAYYIMFSEHGTTNMERQQILTADEFLPHAGQVALNIGAAFVNSCVLIYNSFIRGCVFMFESEAGMIVLIVIAVASSAIGFCYMQQKSRGALILGLILTAAPYLPFFAIAQSTLPFRVVYLSFIGLALVAGKIAGFLSNKASGAVITLLLAAFTIGSIGEINDYMQVSLIDGKAVAQISERLEGEDLYQGDVFIDVGDYSADLSVEYEDHIQSVTNFGWSLTGALRAYRKDINIKRVIPVKNDE